MRFGGRRGRLERTRGVMTRPAASAPLAKAPRALEAEIAALLETDSASALARAEAILKQSPERAPVELLACQALRSMDQANAARARLGVTARAHPRVPAV